MTYSQNTNLRATSKLRRALLLLVTFLVIAGAIALWIWQTGQEERAIADMSQNERIEFYQRTLQNLTAVCADHDDERLADFCREQAELAVRFPECDSSCADLARTFLGRGTR
jgi:hypothetical protein